MKDGRPSKTLGGGGELPENLHTPRVILRKGKRKSGLFTVLGSKTDSVTAGQNVRNGHM